MRTSPSGGWLAGVSRLCPVVVLILMGGIQSVFAGPAPTCTTAPLLLPANAPGGTYTISPEAAVGTLLTPWTAWQEPSGYWDCYLPKEVWAGVVAQATFSGSEIMVEGRGHIVLPSSLSGVGLVIEHTSSRSGGTAPYVIGTYFHPLISTWLASAGGKSATAVPNAQFRHAMRFAFVKTGAMVGGTATVSGQVARVGVDTDPYTNPASIVNVHISGGATFIVPSCVTPDVTVDLGKHKDSDFPTIGSRRGSSGSYSDFSIDLTRCYTHTTSLTYSLHPLNGAVAGMPGLMNLTPASSARGVGIRLMDRSNRNIALDTATQINLASGSRYILLRAAIERTALGTFAGGSVQGQVEFSISYN